MEPAAPKEISWYFFIIIGAIMIVVSAFFIKVLGLFLIIGICFLIYGFWKFMRRKKNIPKRLKKRYIEQENKQFHETSHSKVELSQCPRCFSKVYKHQNFCHQCGYFLKQY